VRARAHQRLGVIALLGAPASAEAQAEAQAEARGQFQESLALCRTHLGGHWAFLLQHDPPGLFEALQVALDSLGKCSTDP